MTATATAAVVSDQAIVDRINARVKELQDEAAKWVALANELLPRSTSTNGNGNGHGHAPKVEPNLRLVVKDVLRVAPNHRLPRKEIIQQVRQRLGPGVKPIGIISTLHARQDFVQVDEESGTYTLAATA